MSNNPYFDIAERIVIQKIVQKQNQKIAQNQNQKNQNNQQELKIVENIQNEAFNMSVYVTDQITELYDRERDKFPWSSFALSNKGPGSVYCCVNDWKSSDSDGPIGVGETVNFPFKQRLSVNKVFLKCDPEQSTTVRLYIII